MKVYTNKQYNVVLTVTQDGCVNFKVNGTYKWVKRTKTEQLAITRWLLKTWKEEVVHTRKHFWCVPSGGKVADGGDGVAYRRKMYTKLGFKTQSGGDMNKCMYYGLTFEAAKKQQMWSSITTLVTRTVLVLSAVVIPATVVVDRMGVFSNSPNDIELDSRSNYDL